MDPQASDDARITGGVHLARQRPSRTLCDKRNDYEFDAYIDRHRSLAQLVDTSSARESQPTSRIRIHKWRE